MNKKNFISPCVHRPNCPGCPQLETPYKEQIQKKQRVLEEYFPDEKKIFRPFVAAKKPLHYRNRAKLVPAAKLQCGLFRKGTHKVISIPKCIIHMNRINYLAQITMREVARRKIRLYDEKQHKGLLRYLIIRQSAVGNQLLLILVTRSDKFPEGKKLARSLKKKVPGLVGVIQNINPNKGNAIEGQENITLEGKYTLNDKMGIFKITHFGTSFFQGNHETGTKLYQAISNQCLWNKTDLVFDLYSGIGLAGLFVAGKVKEVIGLESNLDATRAAKFNASKNNMEHMTFYKGKVENQLPRISQDVGSPDAVILNPPRSGCNKSVLEWILKSETERIVYVSCNPKTLKRDLLILTKDKFKTSFLQGFDIYPQTDHIECLAYLHKNDINREKDYGKKED